MKVTSSLFSIRAAVWITTFDDSTLRLPNDRYQKQEMQKLKVNHLTADVDSVNEAVSLVCTDCFLNILSKSNTASIGLTGPS